jgi:subtilisin family serine protease
LAHPGFSNSGALIDVAAPGVSIVSLRARRTDFNLISRVPDYVAGAGFMGPRAQTYRSTGTSFAAPYVAGLAAELLAHTPTLSAQEVHRLIVHSATDINIPGADLTSGYGLIDMSAALRADPEYFIIASLKGIAITRDASGIGVKIEGRADADQFRSAKLSIGRGASPTKWSTVDSKIESRSSDGELTVVPAKRLQGDKTWTLKLEVTHRNGSVRESRYVMNVE